MWLASAAPPKAEPTLDEKIKQEEDDHLEEIDKMGELRKSLFHRDKRLSMLREQKNSGGGDAPRPAPDGDGGDEGGAENGGGPKVSFHDDGEEEPKPIVDDDAPKKSWACGC